MHVKKQFADDSELSVHMTWITFKTTMALASSVATKKRRMKIGVGLEVEKNLDIAPLTNPPASAPAVDPVASFNTDADDVLIDIKSKGDCDGSGVFKYSSRKIKWLKAYVGNREVCSHLAFGFR